MIRLVQIQHPVQGRRVSRVEDDRLRVVQGYASLYACAQAALLQNETLATLIERALSHPVSHSDAHAGDSFDYEAIYTGRSEWRLLPAFDYPNAPARCLVSGTGLTHRKSADNRNAMHQSGTAAAEKQAGTQSVALTDSMRIYEWGVQGEARTGEHRVQPEWFYKGNGTILRAHGEPLEVPAYAEDGGEEAEIAGAYVIDAQGAPWRVGFAIGNEFSDHQMEARNYLYLAPSKLRACALGPELIVGAAFEDLRGRATVERGGNTLWSQEIASGEANMVHTLANLEHHHFKYGAHRSPGDVHIHFFGTGGFSFGSGVRLEDGDVMIVAFEGYGRPLRNPLRVENTRPALVEVRAL